MKKNLLLSILVCGFSLCAISQENKRTAVQHNTATTTVNPKQPAQISANGRMAVSKGEKKPQADPSKYETVIAADHKSSVTRLKK